MELVWFVLLVGVLIFVHELGHFAWAKFFGVRVLKFSLGFGPKIAGFRRAGTEYVIAAFPLGGYVRMLGENPSDVVSPEEEKRSFHSQPLWRRMVIVFAGPAMNLLFPIALYFVVALGDTELAPPVIGIVFPHRPADGKLQPGDRVLAIEGDEIETFDDLVRTVEDNANVPLHFEVQRGTERVTEIVTPALDVREKPLDVQEEVGRIGVMPHQPVAVIGVTSPSSPAGAARLQTFDVVIAAAGRPVERWIDLVSAIDENRGALVPVTFLRPTRVRDALGGLADLEIFEPRIATVTPEPGTGGGLARAGLELADLYVSDVRAGSPEHQIGILPGDRLLELDGRPIRLWATFLADLKHGRGRSHVLSWRRGDRVMVQPFRLAHERGVNEYGQRFDRYAVGMYNWVPTRVAPAVPNPHPIRYALRQALRETEEVVELTVFSIVRLFQGRLTMKSIAGPLTMFEATGTAAREGALNYLTLMAFISINLGLINLLPIPLLDGGHLLFFGIEAVARRPVSVRVREYASIAGLAVLVLLMVLAFKNDIERQWPHIVDAVTSE